MMPKKIFALFALGVTTLPAHAILISEAMVNSFVTGKFPKITHGVEISSPRISLKEGKAEFCAQAHFPLVPKPVDFCTSLVPLWDPKMGSLRANQLALTSMNAEGFPQRYQETMKRVVNEVAMPALDGTEIYKNDGFIAKQVSSIKVQPGFLDVQL